MTASPNTRRKIAPAAAMVIASLGALALLVTFVLQVVSEAPPRGTEAIRAEVLNQLETQGDDFPAELGKVRPDTLEIIDRTSEGVVAYAFLTTTDALGVGIQASDGGAFTFSMPGDQTASLSTAHAGPESTSDYELSVRRSGSGNGYEHTLTAQ